MPTSHPNNATPIHGYCDDRFSAVTDAFVENFASHNEVGAAVSVYHMGKKVIDLRGGVADINKPWKEDTLCCSMSVSKAFASVAVLSLIDKGICNLEDTIAKRWPEFAQNGKAEITIDMLLSQLACIPVIDNAKKNIVFDEEAMFEGLAKQPPYWEPGSTPCYHSFTYGPLCQKLVHLLAHKSLGRYLREDLLHDLNIDIFIGLTDEEIKRCATITNEDNVPSLEGMKRADTLLGKAWGPSIATKDLFNNEQYRKCEFASGNAHCTARGIAKLYSLLQGDNPIISPALLENATQPRWDTVEQMTQRHFCYGAGFMLSNPHFKLGPNQSGFGHPVLGGSIGFCDPNATSLIDALYQYLG